MGSLAALVTGSRVRAQGPEGSIAVRTLNHVTLRVSNVGRSVKFYQDLFGLPIVNRQANSVGLGVGSSHIGVGQVPVGEQPQINHFCLGVERFDTDQAIKALGAHGVKGSVRMRGEFRELYFMDSDNICVQLQDMGYRG